MMQRNPKNLTHPCNGKGTVFKTMNQTTSSDCCGWAVSALAVAQSGLISLETRFHFRKESESGIVGISAMQGSALLTYWRGSNWKIRISESVLAAYQGNPNCQETQICTRKELMLRYLLCKPEQWKYWVTKQVMYTLWIKYKTEMLQYWFLSQEWTLSYPCASA